MVESWHFFRLYPAGDFFFSTTWNPQFRGGSSLGLAYSIVLTDAAIAPAFPSNTARGGVLFPIVLSVAQGSGSRPDDPEGRRLGAYLMFCAMASLAVSSALWMTATSANPIGLQVVKEFGIEIGFGKWFLVACVLFDLEGA